MPCARRASADWVLDIDIKGYFDSIDWELLLKVRGELTRRMERCQQVGAVPRESDQHNRVEPRSGLRRQTQAVDRGAQRMHVEPVIGYISSLTQADSVHFDAAFRRGLSEMGYVDGQNVRLEYRWIIITDRYSALPAMATDLVQRQVAMIGAFGPPAVLAAKAATATIPIVFVTGADPIKFGFVASFNRPDGNITGIWMVLAELAQKRMQLIRELLPKAKLIALLVNPTSLVAELQMRDAQAAADALGRKLNFLSAVTEKDFDLVFATLVEQRRDALFVSADPFFASRH
jgi:putative ABC transport system substrate-binding protein